MTKPYVEYKSGYKYQIVKEYRVEVGVTPENNIKTDYIELTTGGALIIKKGYAWDGPSGPTFDTPNFMRGSLVHDALYQLLRLKLLSLKRVFRIFRSPGKPMSIKELLNRPALLIMEPRV